MLGSSHALPISSRSIGGTLHIDHRAKGSSVNTHAWHHGHAQALCDAAAGLDGPRRKWVELELGFRMMHPRLEIPREALTDRVSTSAAIQFFVEAEHHDDHPKDAQSR
jgi:hypothetical protein